MSSMRVADYIAKFLADKGIAHVFILPGGGAMYLNDGLACEPSLTAVPCHHEQACGIAAESYGRVNGGFGVAMVTTGPGATNVITPVTGAWIDSIPMMVISGQVKRADLLHGRPLRQTGVQEVDIIPMVKGVTKYAVTVEDPLTIRFHLERACHEMTTGRCGPVWLDIPLDVQATIVDSDSLDEYINQEIPSAVDESVFERVITLLAEANRPLLLAGHGVRLSGAAADFRQLAEQLQIPVVTTWNAMDIIPYNHPLCVGRPGVVALRGPNFAVQNCDLLISVGSRLDNIITAYNPRGFARSAKKIMVDVDLNEIEKLDAEIALPVVSDAGTFISGLLRYSRDRQIPQYKDWITQCSDWKSRYSIRHEISFPSHGLVNHYQCMDALSDVIPENMVVATGSSGLAVEVFYTVFRNKFGQRVFLTSGLGSMGYGLPAAIGACMASGKQRMVAIESDGSLQLNLQELATLRANNLPICLVVLNNGGYASIRNTQRNYFSGRFVGTGPEAGLWMPDLENLAQAYQLSYRKIDDAALLASSLDEAFALEWPLLLDIRLNTDESLFPKVAAIPQQDGSMISMPLEDMSPLLPLEVLKKEMIVPLTEASLRCAR